MEIVTAIRDVGFPAAAFVMLFTLVRTTLAENTRAIQELVQTIRELNAHLVRRQ